MANTRSRYNASYDWLSAWALLISRYQHGPFSDYLGKKSRFSYNAM